VHLFLDDGTEIDEDDYFNSLEDQTVLYASKSSKFTIEHKNGNRYINLSFGFTTVCAGSISSKTSGPKVGVL
jgi:hypothetical protein